MDGENEKGKREGARGERGDKLMRMCACEHVTAEREEKSQRKSMREQASVNSFTF